MITYSLSLLMLLAILADSQGIFIEHHSCVACEDDMCSIDEEFYHHHDSSELDCCNHTEDVVHNHIEKCDLLDASDVEHQSSCTCFAEYIQIPVFQSEIKTYQFIPVELSFVASIFQEKNSQPITQRLYSVGYHAPPDKNILDISLIIFNCSFLC